MLLLQTAFAQEFAAVAAAGSSIAQSAEPTVNIAGKPCCLLMTGIGPRAARQQLTAILDRIQRPELVLSIGLAGGLNPHLRRGQAVLVESVGRPSQDVLPASQKSEGNAATVANAEHERPGKAVLQPIPRPIPANLDRLSSNLLERISVHDLLTLEAPALTAESKRQLAANTTAAMCDMETYAVADVCRQRQLPWIGARVISDTADENIPAWIMTLPRLVEQKRWVSLLGRVATHPQDLPSLIRLAFRMQQLSPFLTQLTIDLVTHVLLPS